MGLVVSFSLFQLSSCKKEIPANTENDLSFQPSTSFPENTHGMLHFKSETHLKQYFSDLNDYLFVDMKDYDTDSLLALIESELAFASLRPILDPENFPIDRNPEDNFLKDEVRMSLLNPDYQISIDQDTYTYFSENTVVKNATADGTTSAQMAAIEKGNDDYVPVELLKPETEILSNKHLTKRTQKPVGSCTIEVISSITPSDCIPFSTDLTATSSIISSDGWSLASTSTSGDWLVEWGDGTSSVKVDSYFFTESHAYAQAGSYTVTVTHEFHDWCESEYLDETTEQENEVTIGMGTCTEESCSDQCHVTVGNYKLRGETWFKHDLFGNHQVAKTTSYQYKSHWLTGVTDWWKDQAVINSQLNYDFRDSACAEYQTNDYHGWSIEHNGNKKTLRADKTRNSNGRAQIADEQVHGYFWILNDSQEMTCDKILNVCD